MNKPHILAFYLPQYRPVKENNEWFGEGFTEWTNVAKAKPLFNGHCQPRVPADLGFYDLRLPQVREKQAELAKEAGVSAFCYYHYWFGNGKKILHETLEEVVECGNPDFPFCLCWANHSWYKKNWNPDTNILEQKMLLEQTYPGDEDIITHFNYLLPAFKDKRYYRIDGRLVFSIYDCKKFPDFEHFKRIWNKLAIENSLPEFYFIGYTNSTSESISNMFDEYDGVALTLITTNITLGDNPGFFKKLKYRLKSIYSRLFNYPLFVFDYKDVYHKLVDEVERAEKVIPVLLPNWDYTPRRGAGGLILKNATPELFGKHVKEALDLIKEKEPDHQILFIKSWNEWGEGNYMEPDLQYGKKYIEILRSVLTAYSCGDEKMMSDNN